MFVTDTILTAIMCAARSVYSWDVVITKVGDKLFFDKRDSSPLCYLTTNETAPDQVVLFFLKAQQDVFQVPEDKDNVNGTHQLSLEATSVNHSFAQQVKTTSFTFKLFSGLQERTYLQISESESFRSRRRKTSLLWIQVRKECLSMT